MIKTDILFLVYNKTDACSFYRSGGVANSLRKLSEDNNIVVKQWSEIEMNWQTICDYDIIMMQRPYNKPAYDLCTYIKRMNRKLWLDFDDNLMDIPPENRASMFYTEEVKGYIAEMLKIADVVTVTTRELAEAYQDYNSNIWVIPNAFNDSIFKGDPPIKKERSNVCFWRGTDTHIYDLMHLGNSFNKLLEKFFDWQFLFVGFKPWFLRGSKNLFYLKEMDLIMYYSNLYKMAPEVMQVPLHDNPFNHCKSNIAFLEGTYFGSVCVVPYWWNLPGTLCYKNDKEYYEAMEAILMGEVDVEKHNRIAWGFIKDTLLLSKINGRRIELINSLKF